jgi:hypothetical protein
MAAEQAGGSLGRVLAVLVAAAARLGRTLTDPDRFRVTLGRLGWDVAEPPAEYAAVGRRALDVVASARAWSQAPPSATDVVELAAQLGALWTEVGSLTAVPASVDPTDFREDVAGPLVEMLLLDSLDDLMPAWHAAAEAAGIAVFDDEPAANGRLRHLRERIDLDQLGRFASDPLGTMAEAAGWGTAAASGADVAGKVIAMAAGAGLPIIRQELREADMSGALAATGARAGSAYGIQMVESWTDEDLPLDVGVDLLAAGSGADAAIEIRPRFDAEAAGTLDLGGGWSMDLATDLDPAAAPGLVIGSNGLEVDRPPGASHGSLDLTLRLEPSSPLLLLGSADGTRLELAELGVSLGLATTPEPDILGAMELGGLALVLAAGDGDGFLAAMLGDGELRYDASASFSYSAASGFSARGAGGLSLTVPLDRQIGPATLERLLLELGGDPDEPLVWLRGRARVDVAAMLLALEARVEGIGVELMLIGGGPTPAPDVAVGFVPPSAVGLSLAEVVIRGGGFVSVDPSTGRYAGALSFDALGVGLDALVVVDTDLTGDPDWALFASLSARFPGVPLGFGFTLTGVGGLISLNRAVDGEALALGLRDGAVDALLFPEDPARDAALLIGQLDEYFPQAPDNTVIGPVIEIGWGAPTIITAQLGVLLSLPQGVITVLGSLTAILPDPDAPILELNMDALGVVDVPAGTVLVTASLYDSRLLGVIELSGDVGLYLSAVEDPYFLLSVGGYHPGFQPPAHVPSALEGLRRMRADVVVGVGVSASITAYFAVTSNSVQFGGGFELEASAEFLTVTYTARGWFEFDVLLRFNPFALVADVSAGVGVYAGSKELLGVELSAHLEGPAPWFATASGRFRFFLVNVRFEVTVGAHAAPALPPGVDVLAAIAAELAHPEAWSARRASTPVAALNLRSDVEEGVVRPDDSVVVVQSVAPFGETLQRLGELTPVQDEVHVADTAVVDGATGEPLSELVVEEVDGWFAPAQYRSMRDEERLSAPSYELHPAGVCFAGGGVGVAADEVVAAPAGHETEVWELDAGELHTLGVVITGESIHIPLASSASVRAAQAWRGPAVDVESVSVEPTSYAVVDAASGVPAVEGEGATRVVPAHDLAVSA